MPAFPTALVRWVGSKGRMRNKILPILEDIDHRCYVEPFGGSAAILLNKKPSELEVYNDVNGGLCALFRSLKNKEHNAQLAELLEFTPIARQERDDLLIIARQYLKDGTINQRIRNKLALYDVPDEVCAAYALFYLQNLGFGGLVFGTYLASSYSMTERHKTYWRRLELFPLALRRLKDVIIESRDFRPIFSVYDNPHTLFFVDPPYCSGSAEYRSGWQDSDEAALCEIVRNCKGSVVLTCYDTDTYRTMLTREAGFRKMEFENKISVARESEHRRDTIETVYIKTTNKEGRAIPADLFAAAALEASK